jgi:L-iditol 2-dehydrogenase
MKETSKAAVLVGPQKYEIQEIPIPELKEGDLLMKVEMSGICGTDKHTYIGQVKQYAGTEAEMDTPFPIIQGHENVGVVAKITKSAAENIEYYGQKLKEGDRIVMCPDIVCGKCFYCNNVHGFLWCQKMRSYGNSFSRAQWPYLVGGWSEYMYLMNGTFVYKANPALKPQELVQTEVMSITCSLDKLKEFSSYSNEGFNSGDTMVIQGVGPIGMMHLIKARIMGAGDIVVIDKSEYRLKMAMEFGANVALNLDKTTKEERLAKIREMTGGRGADVVLEMSNSPHAFVEGIELLRRGGAMLEMGNFADTGEVTINVHRHICSKNIRLIGLTNHPITGYGPSMKLMERYHDKYPFEKLVSHEFLIDDVDKAMQTALSPDSMKVVIKSK